MHQNKLPVDFPKLLIIGMVWPEPQSSAAGTRMLQLIALFQEQNYDITFASAAQESEFSFDLKSINVKTQNIALNCSSFNDFLIYLKPDIVLFDRYIIEEQFGWRVAENSPDAIRILDTEDLHCLRLARQNAVKKNIDFTISDLLLSDIAKREISSLYRCDLTLMISEFEMDILKNTFNINDNLLHYLTLFYNTIEKKLISEFDKRQDFVFIGNFLHEPNFDAVKQLKETIWPLIRKQLPMVKLNIYGAYPSQKVLEYHNTKENFIVHGRAESSENVLKNAKILLAPLRFGAGLKGKILEAMSLGTPIVTTPIGVEGIINTSSNINFITNDFNEFAQKSVALYTNQLLWDSCQKTGFEIIQEKFKKELFQDLFYNKLNHLKIQLSEHRKSNFIGNILQFQLNLSTKYMSRWIEEKNKNINLI